jgi:hypothetical protein
MFLGEEHGKMPPCFWAKIARVPGAISSRIVYVPTGHPGVWTFGPAIEWIAGSVSTRFALKGRRIPAQGNALGLGVAPFMRSEGTPHPG